MQGGYGVIARHVGVTYRRPVNDLSILQHGELVREPEGLAVPDDHPDYLAVGDPRPHPGVHSHLGEHDLVPWSGGWRVRQRRQGGLMRSPADLRRSRSLLPSGLRCSRSHELVDLLGAVRDLSVPLGAVDDLDA